MQLSVQIVEPLCTVCFKMYSVRSARPRPRFGRVLTFCPRPRPGDIFLGWSRPKTPALFLGPILTKYRGIDQGVLNQNLQIFEEVRKIRRFFKSKFEDSSNQNFKIPQIKICLSLNQNLRIFQINIAIL